MTCLRVTSCAIVLAAGLSACVSPIPADGWIELHSDHFRMFSDATPERAREVLEMLETARSASRVITNYQAATAALPTVVYAINSNSLYASLSPRGTAGWATTTLETRVMVVNLRSREEYPYHVVLHEYMHALMYDQPSPFDYPKWYREGIAEYFGTISLDGNELLVGLIPSRARILTQLRRTSVSRLFDPERRVPLGGVHGSLFYASSWLTFHYLVQGSALGFPRRDAQLQDYIARTSRGEPYEDAARNAFGVDLRTLDEEVERYFDELRKGRVFGGVFESEDFLYAGEVEIARLGPADGLTAAADLAWILGRRELAMDCYRRAEKLEPDHADAAFGAALSRALAAQDLEHLHAAADRAGDSPQRSFRAGSLLLSVADRVKDDVVRERLFRHALDLSDSALTRAPDSPALRFVSARARLALEPESDEALAQLESVHARLPFLEPVALALAHSLGLHDQADRARAIAERVARSTENEQIQQQAEEILQKLREAS